MSADDEWIAGESLEQSALGLAMLRGRATPKSPAPLLSCLRLKTAWLHRPEREGGLNQVVKRASLPVDVLGVVGDESPDGAVRKGSGDERQASRLIQHQQHDDPTKCIEGYKPFADDGPCLELFDRHRLWRILDLHAPHQSSFNVCSFLPVPRAWPLSGKTISLGPSLPVVARKVWEFLRSPTRGHRCLAQRGRRTPSSRIVDVDVRRQASFKAVHQPEVHDVIHPPVSARLARHLAIVLP